MLDGHITDVDAASKCTQAAFSISSTVKDVFIVIRVLCCFVFFGVSSFLLFLFWTKVYGIYFSWKKFFKHVRLAMVVNLT